MGPEFFIETAVGLAIDYALSYSDNVENDKFQETVSNSLTDIKKDLQDIEAEIDQLAKENAYFELWSTAGDPIYGKDGINTYYTAYTQGTPVESEDGTCQEIIRLIDAIHTVVCGKQGTYGKAVDLYLATLTDGETNTSRVEKAYNYFSDIILKAMLKGLALLGAYGGKELLDKWYGYYKDGNPDGAEDYFKQPMIAYQGKMFQESIDALSDASHWVGKSDTNYWSYTVSKIKSGTTLSLPEGHALVGIDFVVDGDGDLVLAGWGGKPNDRGFVESPSKVYSSGGTSTAWIPDYPSMNHFYLDKRAILAPEGNVIIGAQWSHDSKFVNAQQQSLEGSLCVFFLKIQYAPLVANGVIDHSKAEWSDGISIDNPDDFADAISADEFVFTHWVDYRSDTAPSGWNTPITGIQRYDNKAVFKADVHRKAFGETEA